MSSSTSPGRSTARAAIWSWSIVPSDAAVAEPTRFVARFALLTRPICVIVDGQADGVGLADGAGEGDGDTPSESVTSKSASISLASTRQHVQIVYPVVFIERAD
jgi:hypothetical protein